MIASTYHNRLDHLHIIYIYLFIYILYPSRINHKKRLSYDVMSRHATEFGKGQRDPSSDHPMERASEPNPSESGGTGHAKNAVAIVSLYPSLSIFLSFPPPSLSISLSCCLRHSKVKLARRIPLHNGPATSRHRQGPPLGREGPFSFAPGTAGDQKPMAPGGPPVAPGGGFEAKPVDCVKRAGRWPCWPRPCLRRLLGG